MYALVRSLPQDREEPSSVAKVELAVHREIWTDAEETDVRNRLTELYTALWGEPVVVGFGHE